MGLSNWLGHKENAIRMVIEVVIYRGTLKSGVKYQTKIHAVTNEWMYNERCHVGRGAKLNFKAAPVWQCRRNPGQEGCKETEFPIS